MGSGVQQAALVAVAAFAVPLAIRILFSPFTLLLLLPFLSLLFVLSILAAPIVAGYALDARRPSSRNGLPSAARPLAFSTPAAWQAVLTRSEWSYQAPKSLKPLHPNSPVVSSALNEILIMIVRDFVLTWYTSISSSPSFPMAVSSTVNSSLERLINRAAAIDHASLMVKRILPKVTAHMEQFRQSEVALRGATLERRLTQSEELDLLLASRYAGKGGGKLHPAVNNLSSTFTKQTEEAHLKQLVERALPHILPEKEARSPAVSIMVREIIACSVLYPVMDMLSDPDFWNRTIDSLAGEAIRQQKLISKVRNVLEAQSPRPRSQVGSVVSPTTEAINVRTDARHFESFLRSINRCSSLLDARRLKNDIMGEIRRTRTLLADHANEDWINGEKTEDVVSFLDRLYTAKRKAEARIVVLGGEDSSVSYPEPASLSRLSLRDVLTNPTSLSYLMEFMDRRHRSLLVQFWLTVESFKNPLESVESGSSDEEDEPLHPQSPAASVTLKEDIAMLHDLYFASATLAPALAAISSKHVENIRSFALDGDTPSHSMERRVRRSVMLAQRQVEQDMEQDFDEFQRSELWFRVAGDPEINSRRPPSEEPTVVTSSVHIPPKVSRRPLPTSLPLLSESTPSLGSLFGSGIQGPSSSSPSIASTSGYFNRATPSATLEQLMSPASSAIPDSRSPLFDDPDEDKVLAPDEAQAVRMDAIQAALTDIIALDNESANETRQPASLKQRGSSDVQSTRSHKDIKRRVLFEDELEGGDDRDGEGTEAEHGSFQMAAPGDLQLSHEISRLGEKIGNLEAQDAMLDTLIKKAELTGDAQELRLLRQSKSSFDRELRELRFQKTQYEQQESANRLISDRTRLSIVNSTVGEENGKSVVRYLIEVQQLATDGTFASGWVVARRYNEFLAMHTKLKDRYALVRNLDFPGKRLVTALSGSFVDTRRTALEKYMQNIVAIPAACESEELRAFLSRDSPFMAAEPRPPPSKGQVTFPGQGLMRSMYKSVTDSIDDMFFGPSMLDVMIQRLTRQTAEFVGIVGSGVNDEDLVAQALKAAGRTSSEATLMRLSGDLKPLDGETSTSTFSAPICDLLLAVFELDEKKNWLRRQAIVIILQQVFGETIERKLRETVHSLFHETRLLSYIKTFRDGLWPGGKLRAPSEPRTPEEKLSTRDDANRKLSALIPDLAANMIGRSNARRGARRIFAVLQNRRLNQHIMYTIVDEVFNSLFPESVP